jgi:hypothetical protein
MKSETLSKLVEIGAGRGDAEAPPVSVKGWNCFWFIVESERLGSKIFPFSEVLSKGIFMSSNNSLKFTSTESICLTS